MNAPQHQNFRVDLGGVIALLSKNLYSGPGVYIRELIQNAFDATIARGALADRTIEISPYGVSSPGSPADQFTITDHGIGVTADQVEQFLATVGASSKREELERNRRSYIGQFGIGLLSCFLIADEITVISRSATESEPIEWTGNRDGTYTIRPACGDVPIGTTVRLRPRPDMIGWARVEQVTPLAQKYAEFLPISLSVLQNAGTKEISRNYPWLYDFGAHRSSVQQGISPIYGGIGSGRKIDAIEIHDVSLGLHGVIYFHNTTNARNRVYVNDMLVDDADDTLLPQWAFFASAVLSSTTLEPTASRETLVHNQDFVHTKRRLSRAVLQWLRSLADDDPARFAEFVADNELDLRSAATRGTAGDNLELAEAILPMLTMQTTEGHLRLIDIVDHNPNILYAMSVKDFRTIASFTPHGRVVVNAGHALDQEVLQMLPQVMPGVTVSRVYPAAEVAALTAPSRDTVGDVMALEQRGSSALHPQGCDVAVRRFPTTDLPAVFIGRGQIDVISPGYSESAHLVLNWDNRAVQALTRTTDDLVFGRLVQLLYVQSRLAAQCDGPEDRALLSEALDDVIVLAAGVDGTELKR